MHGHGSCIATMCRPGCRTVTGKHAALLGEMMSGQIRDKMQEESFSRKVLKVSPFM